MKFSERVARARIDDLMERVNKISGILSGYDMCEFIKDVPEDEWCFAQKALLEIKEVLE